MLVARVVLCETWSMESNPMLEEIRRIKNLTHLPQVFTQEAEVANRLLALPRLR